MRKLCCLQKKVIEGLKWSQGNGEMENLRYSGRQARKTHSGRGLVAVLKLSQGALEEKDCPVKGMSTKLFCLMCKESVH